MRPSEKPLIVLLVKRAVFFMGFLCFLFFFLYSIGTAQGFLESTQLFLLRTAYRIALLLGIGALYGVVLDGIFAYRLRSRRLIWGALAYALLAGVAVLAALLSGGLLVAVVGNAA